jgi:hypothetical protein
MKMTSKIIMTYEHCPVELCNLRDDFSIPLFTTRGVKSLLLTGVGSKYYYFYHFIITVSPRIVNALFHTTA